MLFYSGKKLFRFLSFNEWKYYLDVFISNMRDQVVRANTLYFI